MTIDPLLNSSQHPSVASNQWMSGQNILLLFYIHHATYLHFLKLINQGIIFENHTSKIKILVEYSRVVETISFKDIKM